MNPSAPPHSYGVQTVLASDFNGDLPITILEIERHEGALGVTIAKVAQSKNLVQPFDDEMDLQVLFCRPFARHIIGEYNTSRKDIRI